MSPKYCKYLLDRKIERLKLKINDQFRHHLEQLAKLGKAEIELNRLEYKLNERFTKANS